MPIQSFADQMTADVAAGLDTKASRKLPKRVWAAAQRKLDMLQAARTTFDLVGVESLKYTKPGFFSMRVNDQYRLFFRFQNGDATDVYLEGYDHTGRR